MIFRKCGFYACLRTVSVHHAIPAFKVTISWNEYVCIKSVRAFANSRIRYENLFEHLQAFPNQQCAILSNNYVISLDISGSRVCFAKYFGIWRLHVRFPISPRSNCEIFQQRVHLIARDYLLSHESSYVEREIILTLQLQCLIFLAVRGLDIENQLKIDISKRCKFDYYTQVFLQYTNDNNNICCYWRVGAISRVI